MNDYYVSVIMLKTYKLQSIFFFVGNKVQAPPATQLDRPECLTTCRMLLDILKINAVELTGIYGGKADGIFGKQIQPWIKAY